MIAAMNGQRRATAAKLRASEARLIEKGLAGGPLLKAILTERGIRPTDFARRIGRKYHNVARWFNDREFTPENRGLCTAELGLPLHTFGEAVAARGEDEERLVREAEVVFAAFLNSRPIAAALTAEDREVLESIRFAHKSIRPTVAFYEAVAFALRGAIRVDEILTVAEENARLDRALAHKPPLKRR
jgi:hypothetical protein